MFYGIVFEFKKMLIPNCVPAPVPPAIRMANDPITFKSKVAE